MNRIILSILLVTCFCDLFARDYFVGGAGASDNNPGTAAQPFATIQKAASVAVTGDVVNIRSGTYRETIVPANSGVTFQSDAGATVMVSGLDEAGNSGWTLHSGNIYKKTITLPVSRYNQSISNNTTLAANQVFKDGEMQFEARWPKINNPSDLFIRDKVYRGRLSTNNWTTTSLSDPGIPNIPGGWAGGKIYIIGWFIAHTTNITSHSGGTIGFNSPHGDLRFHQYYYLTGKLGALTQAKEWHYESNTLYFWQEGGGSPTGVEFKARNWGFDIRGKSNITIKGLQFIGCEPVVGDINSSNALIDGIKSKFQNHTVQQEGPDVIYFNARQTGIKLIGPNSTIKNSEIQFVASQAIWLGANCRAENNLITDVNYEANYGAAIGVWETTGGQVITRNTIARMGRSAIDYGGYVTLGQHQNMDISYNDVYHFGMLHADVGGMYGARMNNLTGTRIHHNWIHDNLAVVTPVTSLEVGCNAGIYFDQACGPTTVDHNVFWNNYQVDYVIENANPSRAAGPTKVYNNTFATANQPNHVWARSYLTFTTATQNMDIQRNNIYRDDLFFNWNGDPSGGNVQYCLLNTQNPSFVGTGGSGLNYRLNAGSPAINAGVIIPGITDGSVGAPDIGAYEYGGTAWVPGYQPQASTPPANTLPVISITAPANNVSVAQGSPITITATATDANGSITKVEFFDGTTKLGEDLTGPYSFSWSNAAAGTHTITARATDNANGVTTSAAITIVITGNTAPNVSITAPANNAQLNTGSTITISAAATDADGSVTKVEFFNGTTKLGEDLTSPYSFAWANAPAGTHTLTARATDNGNRTTTSAAVTIRVATTNTAPSVSITAPVNNTQFTTGNAITITASASDANGSVTKVEFFTGTTKLGEDLTSPYTFVWNNAAVRTHTVTARATDNSNAVTTSAAITIRVISNANELPAVAITSPKPNMQFPVGSSVTIGATASDPNGTVTKVEFFSGTTKLGEDLTAPYSFSWSNATAGTYTITAKATDNLNAVTTSTAVSIVIVAGNASPSAAITSPANNSTFQPGATVQITASATDLDGTVSKVEFFMGTTKLGEDLTAPYSFDWSAATEGTYMLTVKATDNQSSIGTSDPIQIIVGANALPVVTVTSPGPGVDFTVGETIVIEVEASDANGSITKIEFFDGDTKLGEVTSGPYSFTWENIPAGTHSLYAIATDDENGVTTSEKINISIIDPGTAPESADDLSSAIPRVFTPNGDGIEDFWIWDGIERFENSSLIVYNRSGQTIYEAFSYNNSWDGTMNGQPLQPGDYYYVLRLPDSSTIQASFRIYR